MTDIFAAFDERDRALWGSQPQRLRHHLAERDLFSDASLAGLIERLPPEQVLINTMDPDGHDVRAWAYCDRGGRSGEEVLDAVRRGRLWINMVGLAEAEPRFRDLLDDIYDELERRVPGLRTRAQRLGLLVSSPGAQVYYHCDVPCQTLWQLRGRKRIWIYPATEPFLRAAELEDVVRGVSEEEISYEPWFDEYARSFVLTPGDVLHWPLNAPHRIVNEDVLNVSLTTEHWTRPSRASYLTHYGNGVLRSHLRRTPRPGPGGAPALLVKAGLATAWRLAARRHRPSSAPRATSFVVDPGAPLGRRPVPELVP